MKRIQSNDVEATSYRGRNIKRIVETGGITESKNLSMGMAEFSTSLGPMLPHKHDEEGIYVLDAKNAFTRCGSSVDQLGERLSVESGMFLLYEKDEWHIFEFEGDGYLKIIFFFATGNLHRPA